MKNRFSFGGNIAREVESKSFTAKGKEVKYVSMTVAVNHPRKPDAKAKFVEVQLFDTFSGDIALKLPKGYRVYVEGELSWDEGSKGGEFLKLSNASFMPGWLPPKADAVATPSAPALAIVPDDELPF